MSSSSGTSSIKVPSGTKCEWCEQDDTSTWKDPKRGQVCLTCNFILANADCLNGSEQGRKFLRKLGREAKK